MNNTNENLPAVVDESTGELLTNYEIDETTVFAFLRGDNPASFYSSFTGESEAEKVALFNAATNSDDRLKSYIGKVLEITNYFCQMVTVKNSDSGRAPHRAPRIVLIDKDGKAYGCVSVGILSALERLVGVFGPAPWVPALRIEPMLISKGTNNVLTLKAHARKG